MDDIVDTVIALAATFVDEPVDGPEAELPALGLTSLKAVQFMVSLEEAYAVSFPEHMIDGATFRTPRSAANAVATLKAPVELRPTDPAELPAMVAAEADDDTRCWLGDITVEWHRALLADGDVEHLSIVHSGELAGFVVLVGVGSGDVELRRIVTFPGVRGRGLGRAALTAAVERAWDRHGARRLWLDVKTHNDRARALYRAIGLVEERVVPDAVPEPDGTSSALVIMSVTRDAWRS